MTSAIPSSARINITKIALAGALLAMPAAAMNIPAYATPGVGGTANSPAVITAPPPADPPTDAPQPPPPQSTHGEYYNPNDQDDWWVYSGTGSF